MTATPVRARRHGATDVTSRFGHPGHGDDTIPRSNLLSSTTYQGTTLAPAFGALTPYLNPLTGPMGPLHQLEIILAAGFSDDGDGTYARGLVEAVRTSIVVNTASVAHTLGRAYSAADAERAFSTATDPALPPGTKPTSNAAAAFPRPERPRPPNSPSPTRSRDPNVNDPAPTGPVSRLGSILREARRARSGSVGSARGGTGRRGGHRGKPAVHRAQRPTIAAWDS